MDFSVLEKSTLFSGVPTKELRDDLEAVPHHIQCYDKGETVFHLMEDANRIGVILAGRVQAQKPFPNGSQVNVSVRNPGEMIGPAAVFSKSQKYPCQKDLRIMKNFMAELATATYMLQQRLELLSYSGISQKAACFLLIQSRQSGKNVVRIPESVSNWAMVMNVSRSSLHRELKKLEMDGIITYDPPTIEIHDNEALQNVLSK